jgi:uncharacterized protein (TIGR02186 family)
MSVLKRAFVWGLLLCCSAWLTGARADSGMLTDLASSHVKITTGFTGQHVFVFGSTSRSGDIVIRVTSPDESAALSRKERVGPFWLKGGKQRVDHVPGLVYLLSNRPLNEIADRLVLERHGLTFHSNLAAAQVSGGPTPGYEDWQTAFERLKQKQGLFRKLGSDVRIDGGRLFSANFPLPATLPIGAYRLDIYAFRNGRLVAHRSSVLQVNEVGIELWLSQVALDYSWVFGLLFTLLAVALGLTLSMLLRRDHGRRL